MRFTSNLALPVTLSLSISFAALANTSPESPNFDYLQYGYTQFDDSDNKLDGYHIKGSYSFSDGVFVRGRYQDVSDNIDNISFDVDMTTLAIGYNFPVSKNISYYAAASYEQIDEGTDSGNNDGFGAYLGAKNLISPQVELYGELNYININDLDKSEIGYEFGAQYYFNYQWSVGVNYRKFDDVSLINAGLRLSF
jgi:predicted porin